MSTKTPGDLLVIDATGVFATGAGVQATNMLRRGTPVAFNVTDVAWTRRFRADSITGSGAFPADGTAVASWFDLGGSGGPAVQASSPAKPTLKTSILNGQPIVRFAATQWLTAVAGSAGLNGAFYGWAVIKPTVSTAQNLISWGDSGTGNSWRDIFFNATNPLTTYFYDGAGAFISGLTLPASTWCLFEFQWSPLLKKMTFWVNGTQIDFTIGTLLAYSSTTINIGNNNSLNQSYLGDIAEIAVLARDPSRMEIQAVRDYVNTRYGLSATTYTLTGVTDLSQANPGGTGSAFMDCTVCTTKDSQFVINGITPLNTGGTVSGFVNPATYSLYGNFAAHATGNEHRLSSFYGAENVLALWNTSTVGFSAIRFCRPGATGEEMMAAGVSYVLFPFGGPNMSSYIETSNFNDGSLYGDFRLVQTKVTGGLHKLRLRVRDDTQAIEFYDLTAAEPSVSGPTTGLVTMIGRPVTSVADSGTLDTNVTTGATQCGMLVVKDTTNSKCAIYRLENTALTLISADAEFSTTIDTSSKVNVYNNSGQIRLQNKTGGALNLTASFY